MADEKTFTQEQLDAAVEKAVGDVDGLKSKIDELIGDNKKLKADLRKTQDIKPEDVATIEAERDKALADLAEAQKQVKTITGERDKAVKALETESGFTQKLLIQDGIKTALIEHGVKDPDFIDSLTAKFSTGAKVIAEGDERKAVYTTKDGEKPLGDFIKEWAGTDTGKKFVAAPANGGGGAQGGGKVSADVKTMTRSAYNALDQNAKAELGPQMAKGELKLVDEAA